MYSSSIPHQNIDIENKQQCICILDSIMTSIVFRCLTNSTLFCPTLTKGSKSQIIQICESDVFRFELAYSTSIPSLEQKHSSCWKIFKSRRHNDIALMSMYMTDTFCSFTRNFIFKSCFLLSEYTAVLHYSVAMDSSWIMISISSPHLPNPLSWLYSFYALNTKGIVRAEYKMYLFQDEKQRGHVRKS